MTDQELLQAIRTIVREETTPIRLELENNVYPAIQKLAEGQENILEHIDNKVTSRTEDLQSQLDILRAAVKQHSTDIRELKKAQ